MSSLNDLNGDQRIVLSEPGGSSVHVLLRGARVVSWKNNHGQELLYTRNETMGRPPTPIFGGISLCFQQISNSKLSEELQEYARNRLWKLENSAPLDHQSFNNSHSSAVNLVLRPSEKDMKTWPYRLELRLKISLAQGKLILVPSLCNTGDKPFSFKVAIRNFLSVSEISEVRVEGLETLEYLDNLKNKERFTEQADALTFDVDVNRVYLNTPSKIAVIDHGKKRTFVLQKHGLPDTVVCNTPWKKTGKSLQNLGDRDCKNMLYVESAVIENPTVLKPYQVWRGFQEIATVSSSYCSGQLDPKRVLQYIS